MSRITPDDDPSDRLYDTDWNKGADTSWTLPKAIIEDDQFYRVVLRIRDRRRVGNLPNGCATRAVGAGQD